MRLPEPLISWFDVGPLPVGIRYSEAQEFYFAVFLMISILLSIIVRLGNLPRVAMTGHQ